MGKSNLLVIIVVLIVAAYVFYYNPDILDVSRTSKIEPSNLGRGTYFQNSTVDSDIGVINESKEADPVVEDPESTRVVIPGVTNQCGYRDYAYPNYLGTQKEGNSCIDVPESERDLECFSNSPISYDGEIDLVTLESSPKITCCDLDGTCQW